ncbi:asparagine--tRNA ligase [Buchnera aphidicola]|uniref:asparagine--tRNA ligase n=1 Tax=Buchnera aphidicola TaxID=9 RepID=UPI0034648FE4
MRIVSIHNVYTNENLINKEVKIFGWIRNRRHSKSGVSFIDIYDGSCLQIIQCIVKKNIISNYNSEILKISIGCSVCVIGKVISTLDKYQKYELQTNTIKVIGWVEKAHQYPISSKKHTYEYLRSVPHLRSRTHIIGVITRIRNNLFHAIHKFFYNNNYYWIPTPIITSLDTEGSGSMFRVSTLDMNNIPKNKIGKIDFKKDFFGQEAFLTVSGQLTAEAYACSMGKVYTFGPTFRAENSNTTRHLSEFWMLEVEQSFSNLEDIINISIKMLKYVVKFVLKYCKTDMDFLYNNIDKNIFKRLETFLFSDMVHINYEDAIEILSYSKKHFNNEIKFGMDLSIEHEKYLIEHFCNIPIVIKNYPKNLKAFYMRVNDDNKTVAAMDLLVPKVGEIIGGSQREDRKNVLKERFLELDLNIKNYSWYIDLRRYGSVPHSGFGLGFERLMSYITGVKNIKDIIPFPRTVRNILC